MTNDGQGQALLAAILDNPADDLRRLVYADWLEEHGQDRRAEFIRVQVALAGDEAARNLGSSALGDPRLVSSGMAETWRKREKELLDTPFQVWGLVDAWDRWAGPATDVVPKGARYSDHVTFRRGFVESVRCTMAAWLDNGRAIVRAHPVTSISITDREPAHFQAALRERWGWFRETGQGVEDILRLACRWWEMLAPRPAKGSAWKFYPSKEAAQDDFGRVLLVWAKSESVHEALTS